MALTEHGNVSSHFQLEKAAKAAGIKPIYGLEAYCAIPGEEGARQRWKNHLTILAEDQDGYRALNRVVTQSYLDFFQYPTVTGETLRNNSEGLVVLSGCAGSLLACTLLGGKGTPEHNDIAYLNDARIVAETFRVFFPDRYFLEIQPFPELERTCAINTWYEKISRHTGIPLIVTHDVHYPKPEDAEMQAVLHAVHRGKATVEDQLRSWNYEVPLTLPSSDSELQARLEATGLSKRAAQGAIAMSAEIADLCNVDLPRAERLRYPISEDDLAPWV